MLRWITPSLNLLAELLFFAAWDADGFLWCQGMLLACVWLAAHCVTQALASKVVP